MENTIFPGCIPKFNNYLKLKIMAQLRVTILKDRMRFDADVIKFMRQNGMDAKDEQIARRLVSKIDFVQTMDISGMAKKMLNSSTFREIGHDMAMGREFKYEYLK